MLMRTHVCFIHASTMLPIEGTTTTPGFIPAIGDELFLVYPEPRLYVVSGRRIVFVSESRFRVDVYVQQPGS